MKAFASILTLLFGTSLLAGSPCGMALPSAGCCYSHVVEITCCGETTASATSDCRCSFEAASKDAPALLPPPPAAPRASLAALIHTHEDPLPRFRTSEKISSRFPNVGNGPPLSEAAYLQIWRC